MKQKTKLFTRIMAILLVVMMVLSFIPLTSAASYSGFGYSQLNDAQRAVYATLAELVPAIKTEGVIAGLTDVAAADLVKASKMFVVDYPQYFYYGEKFPSANVDENGVVTIQIQYTIDGDVVPAEELDRIQDRINKYEARVKEILGGASGSAYDKSLHIYNTVCKTVSYRSGSNDQNAYGALVEGKAVCAGYARAYQDLMNRAGIKTWFIGGEANNGSYTVSHAWNVSWIDGDCVYTDTTWGDKSTISYDYFNRSKEVFDADHFPDSGYNSKLGSCGHDNHGYKKADPVVVPTIGVTLNVESINLVKVGDTYTLEATIRPSDATNKKMIFSSSDEKIATVDDKGVVKAVAEGEATITVKTEDGEHTATCKVTVGKNATGNSGNTSSSGGITTHVHVYIPVAGKDATCIESGVKDHFKCSDCSELFILESDGIYMPVDEQELVIEPQEHTADSWNNGYNKTHHYQFCSVCKEKQEDTMVEHFDDNKDGKCDACPWQFPEETKPTETKPVETEPNATEPATKPAEPDETKPKEDHEETKPVETKPADKDPDDTENTTPDGTENGNNDGTTEPAPEETTIPETTVPETTVPEETQPTETTETTEPTVAHVDNPNDDSGNDNQRILIIIVLVICGCLALVVLYGSIAEKRRY